jgi:cell division protein FtsB
MVEIILITLIIAIIYMTLRELLQNFLHSRNSAVVERDAVIESLRIEVANLQAQVVELQDAKNFLAEQGF